METAWRWPLAPKFSGVFATSQLPQVAARQTNLPGERRNRHRSPIGIADGAIGAAAGYALGRDVGAIPASSDHLATPNCLIEDGGGVAGFRSVSGCSAGSLSNRLSPAGWLSIDRLLVGCPGRGVARKRRAGSPESGVPATVLPSASRRNHECDHWDRSAEAVACGVRDR